MRPATAVASRLLRHSRPTLARCLLLRRSAPPPSSLSFSSRTSVDEIPAVKLDASEDFVKETIKRMICDRNDDDAPNTAKHAVDKETIEKRFRSLQKWYDEARSCISDCQEASQTQDYDTELEVANTAVEKTFASYLDFIEDVQRADNNIADKYHEIRLENAAKLRHLRQELGALQSRRYQL